MSAQEILTTAFHAVTICFTLLIVYNEITRVIFSRKALQVSELHQLQLNLSKNIASVEDHSIVSSKKTTYKEIYQEQILLPQTTEDKPIDLAEFRNSLKPIKSAKQNIDFSKMNLKHLRKECSQMGIKWRDAVTDTRTGKKRHLRKAEIVVALQQKLSA
ncbi:MAG: hypothetical protein DSM106950_10390 [Stigonema ocellatum SAG 48.90 = DSM 106950]|nr:hypothetical protein [Stigonema ocellatum SAG 48.90 = DSM 106950]